MASHVIEKAGHWGERNGALSAGVSLSRMVAKTNLRKMGRQPRGLRGDSPSGAFRTAEGARGA